MTIHRADYSSNQNQQAFQQANQQGGYQADHYAAPPFVPRGDSARTESWSSESGLIADTLGLTGSDADIDPVEAYFECITTCSLDDGECVTSCTEILREHS